MAYEMDKEAPAERSRASRFSSFVKALSYPVSVRMEVEEARLSTRHRMAPIDMNVAKLAPRENINPRIRRSNFSTTSFTWLSIGGGFQPIEWQS